MKNRYLTAVLALFFGAFGVHRFYLGQKGLGIAYIAMFFFLFRASIILGIIDCIVFLAMDQDEFDHRYNKKSFATMYKGSDKSETLAERKRYFEAKQAAREHRHKKKKSRRNRWKSSNNRKIRKLKRAGEKAFHNYDLERAIEQYEQAIKLSPKDAKSHYRLACAYSLMEKTERAFFHLDRAVRLGWNDKEQLENEDALAYIRVRPLWNTFVENAYRLPSEEEKKAQQKQIEPERDTLLDQLKRLAERREQGEITEQEFKQQKEKLFDRE